MEEKQLDRDPEHAQGAAVWLGASGAAMWVIQHERIVTGGQVVIPLIAMAPRHRLPRAPYDSKELNLSVVWQGLSLSSGGRCWLDSVLRKF